MNYYLPLVYLCYIISFSAVFAENSIPSTVDLSWERQAIQVFPSHTSTKPSKMLDDGKQLFITKFNLFDGAGRPGATGDSKPTPRTKLEKKMFHRLSGPDANSCAGCHNQPIIGGSGDFVANVFVGAHMSDPPTTFLSDNTTNERNTISLFGSGAIELLAREITTELHNYRDSAINAAKSKKQNTTIKLTAKGINFGQLTVRRNGSLDTSKIKGIDDDLIVRPFGVKGVAASLREFTIFALNQHHGIQAIERFGWERTGVHDFDKDGIDKEFTIGQVTSLVLFQANLMAPRIVTKKKKANSSGKYIFEDIGCSKCHIPQLSITTNEFKEPSPYNRPGAATQRDIRTVSIQLPYGEEEDASFYKTENGFIVSAYTDLKRHVICDREIKHLCNEKVRQDNVPTEQFLTAKLWDLATSSPYCHRGDCSTLSEAIIHHGGEARKSRDNFLRLSAKQKKSLISFLLSLGSKEEVL